MNPAFRGKVIMLPTKKQPYIIKERITNITKFSSFNKHQRRDNQHLYIISEDGIKEGDWFLADSRINTSSNNGLPNWILCKCTEVKNTLIYCNEIPNEGHSEDWCKKIIATTDESLTWIEHDDTVPYPKGKQHRLPQPSQQFIEKYIESYNKGFQITDISVEHEEY